MTTMRAIRAASAAGETFGVDDLPCATATYLGYWEREGLTVDWIPVRGGVAAIKALERGEVDVAYGGLGPALVSQAEGQPTRIFCSMSLGLAQALVAQKSILSPADLPGKTWAVDGIGAMSHNFGRQVVRALGIDEAAIDWRPIGPPPERIGALTAGEVDVSLIRYEESIWAPRAHPNLHTLISFEKLVTLAPVQTHGVLATTRSFEQANAPAVLAMTRGMILASRELHRSREVFVQSMRRTLEGRGDLTDQDLEGMWQQMHEAGSFAVNGGMSPSHWSLRADAFRQDYPSLAGALDIDAALAPEFVRESLGSIGIDPVPFDQPA